MQFCNDKWYELTGHPRVQGPENIAWRDLIVDQGPVAEAWRVLLTEKTPQTFEFRLRRTWSNVEGAEGPTWIQANAFPELNKDGTIRVRIILQTTIGDLMSRLASQQVTGGVLDKRNTSSRNLCLL